MRIHPQTRVAQGQVNERPEVSEGRDGAAQKGTEPLWMDLAYRQSADRALQWGWGRGSEPRPRGGRGSTGFQPRSYLMGHSGRSSGRNKTRKGAGA